MISKKNVSNQPMNEYPLLHENEGIPLFYPYIPDNALNHIADTLSSRWIGQGPKVDKFETLFQEKFLNNHYPVAVGSGTDALHLAYLLAGLQPGDEIITPVFTCTATNIPLLYIGAKIVFADIDPITMNINIDDVKKKITDKTKAIVCVDYGGTPCDYSQLTSICDQYNITLIVDAAHSLGTTYNGVSTSTYSEYAIYSFQAIKTLTTGDGGLLAIRDHTQVEKAKRLRWFGIDRSAKQQGVWENDITEVGYKYQMNDISAALGLAALDSIDHVINHRRTLFKKYKSLLRDVTIVGDHPESSCWLMTVLANDRTGLMRKLRDYNIESAQVHYRNDRYTIFNGRRMDLPCMDQLEDQYLVLPLHMNMNENHVEQICDIISSGW